MIPFNKPYLTGKETHYIYQAVNSGQLSGNGIFTKKCHQLFQDLYGFRHCLLTTSCTDALEMAALLINIRQGDEVIMPAYTFVSTANAFALRGARIVFADSLPDHPNIDVSRIEALITLRTRALVVVHYAGVACDMGAILQLAKAYNLYVIEDAAQAIDSYYLDHPLGSLGHLATFSFHETKNIISGEGGLLVVNDESLVNRSEIIWEKGTNRSAFWRGEVDKYHWVDLGSSFLPSEVVAAFLYAQLENIVSIQARRKEIWHRYYEGLSPLADAGFIKLPDLPHYATNNAHLFYLICRSVEERTRLINCLKEKGIHAVFHYLSLHKSPFYVQQTAMLNPNETVALPSLPNSDLFSDCLLRLPLFFELTSKQIKFIFGAIQSFYKSDVKS